jgi:hypothetical protein
MWIQQTTARAYTSRYRRGASGIRATLQCHRHAHGWNHAPRGELCDRDGSYAPFAATRAEREAKNDPRLSLEERYGSHAAYVNKVEHSVQKLLAARLLLKEDAEQLVERAKSAEVAKWFGR